MYNYLAPVIIVSLFTSCSDNSSANQVNEPSPGIEHVVVIGVDGLSPDGIRTAPTPIMDSLLTHGAVSWKVRTVLPSASSQNWASMIMGAGPEIHGITSNDWQLDKPHLSPVVKESDGRFPTIFSLLKQQKPASTIGVVHHWRDFGRLFQQDAVDYKKHFSSEDSCAIDMANYIVTHKPTLAFLHLDHVDHAGHDQGHGSDVYYQSVTKADSLIGVITKSIHKAGMAEKTAVMVISDHGGKDKGHGGESEGETSVALLISGAGVKKGYEVQHPVYMYDLAATIAFTLGVKTPYAWTGRPTKAAFEGYNEPE